MKAKQEILGHFSRERACSISNELSSARIEAVRTVERFTINDIGDIDRIDDRDQALYVNMFVKATDLRKSLIDLESVPIVRKFRQALSSTETSLLIVAVDAQSNFRNFSNASSSLLELDERGFKVREVSSPHADSEDPNVLVRDYVELRSPLENMSRMFHLPIRGLLTFTFANVSINNVVTNFLSQLEGHPFERWIRPELLKFLNSR